MTKMRKISLSLFCVLLSAVCVLSGVMIWRELSDRQKDKDAFRILAERIEPDETPTEPDESQPSEDAEEAVPSGRNLAPLFAENDECIGWIHIPGTVVDYPVMHTPGNPQKYLRRNFNKEYSQSGVPFLDGRCSLQSGNLILFGHNMKNGTMFSAVTGYAAADYQKEHPVIEFETADGCTVYTVFAAVSVKKTDAWYNFIEAENQEDFDKAISAVRRKARYDTGIVPAYGEKILTLSTCYGSSRDDRLIVLAVGNHAAP